MRSPVRSSPRSHEEAAGRRPVRTPRVAARMRRSAAAVSLVVSIVTVRSRRVGFHAGAFQSLRVFNRASLADHRDFDLAGVLQRVLDLLRDIARESRGLKVVELFGLDHDADLAARLDRERLLDTREAVRHALELLQSLDVVRDDLAPSARARSADGVGGRDERADHGHRLHIAVMADDSVDDRLREAVPLEELAANNGVRALDFVIDRLSDVVQEAGPFHRLRVVSRFRREHSGDVRDFDRVTKHVLAVRRSEVQTSKEFHEVRVEAPDAYLVDRGFGRFLHDLIDLGPRLADHLFDTRGMDASVHEKPLERALRDLAADGVEAGDDDGLGRVGDDPVGPGERLEGADVPALAADDPGLHVVAPKSHDGDAVLGCVLGGVPLERHGDDVASSLVRPLARFDLELAYLPAGDVAHFLLDPVEKKPAGLLHRQRGDAGQLRALPVLELCDFPPLALELLLLLTQAAVALVDLGDLLIELLVLLVEPALVALELGSALAVFKLGGLGNFAGFVLGLEDDLVLPGPRLGEQAVSVRPCGRFTRERERTPQEKGDPEADDSRDEGHKAHDDDVGHVGDPFRAACAGTVARVTAVAPVFA